MERRRTGRAAAAPPQQRRAFLVAAATGGAGLLGAGWWLSSRGPGSSAGPAGDDIRLMAELAGVPEASIRPSTGGIHVVYHVTSPLPSASVPRADGKATLVWFGATW